MRTNLNFGCIVSIIAAVLFFYFIGPYALFLLPVLGVLGLFPAVRNAQRYRGSFFDSGSATVGSARPLLILFAAIMNADGRVMRTELLYVSNALKRLYPPEQVPALIDELKQLLHQNLSIEGACDAIVEQYSLQSRVSIIHMLVGLAKADGTVDPQERYLLYQIAGRFNVNTTYVDAFLRGNTSYSYNSSSSYNSQNGYYPPRGSQSVSDPYKVLGIDPTATDAQVKAAYRKLVNTWHPDRFQNKSESELNEATEKFKEIQAAYEVIQNARGMK
jgi:dnaJ domain protein